jgi:hypothetical protein
MTKTPYVAVIRTIQPPMSWTSDNRLQGYTPRFTEVQDGSSKFTLKPGCGSGDLGPKHGREDTGYILYTLLCLRVIMTEFVRRKINWDRYSGGYEPDPLFG